jgi:hypothetical protein
MNFFDTYTLLALIEESVPAPSFFRDRYFPTGEGDIFASDKVLVEYSKGSQKMAAFVDTEVGDIPVGREGYKVFEYAPPCIAPSRPLSVDDLKKRGFGEALLPGSTPAARAAKITQKDLGELGDMITRREEWMSVQTMINNSCTIQTYIDGATQGQQLYVKFFDSSSDHTYTVGDEWDDTNGDFFGDVKAMCRMLNKRGLKAADLILGTDAADAVLGLQEVRDLLNKNSGIIVGQIEEELSRYQGISFMGILNFGGFKLNLICADEQYDDGTGTMTNYFPEKGAMVTAPGCGHMVYGQVTQIDFGDKDYTSHAGRRVPKFSVNQDKNIRKLTVTARPLAVPMNYCPYIYAANAVL